MVADPGNKLLIAIFRQHHFYYFFNMDKTDFVTWLQGYILGVTGTELNQDQIERIRNNLEKVHLVQVPKPAETMWHQPPGPNGELYRC